jgi:DNA-binding transcriptional MocR family regulator
MSPYNEIQIDHESELPYYIQVFQAIKQMILDQNVVAHSKLPPIRKLASLLEVNNGTIVSAYKQLEVQDLVYSKPGSGTYVADEHIQESEPASYSLSLPDANETVAVDFTSNNPEPDLFPVEAYKHLVDMILNKEGGYAFSIDDAQGYLPLRESLALWLGKRSIPASPDRIHVTSGSQQSLDIVSKALIRRNDVVAVESPVYPGALATISSQGAKILEIPLKADGLDLVQLEERAKRNQIRFLYTMPCFQNPTGVTWTLQKKQKLLSLAKQYGFYILEDDFLSEFSYGSKNIQTLKELDSNNQVIYIKSIAKLLMPGMRLGFILAPAELSDQIRTNKYLADLSTSGLSQRVVDLYLRTEDWESAFKSMNAHYRSTYQLLTQKVTEHFPPEVTYIPPQGGFSLWFELPEGISSSLLAQRAARLGIRLNPGNIYYMNQTPNRYFRLAFGKTSAAQIRSCIPLLGNLLKVIC